MTEVERQLSFEKHINSANNKIDNDKLHPFPATRFQGSKHKVTEWIWESTKTMKFNSVLDAFGGTGCVAHMFKRKGKKVAYNDLLKFNHIIGKALIENNEYKLNEDEVTFILNKHKTIKYPTFIQDKFQNIFYLDEENEWLDMVITNINNIDNEYKKAIAMFALFQSCIIKRPYNLFHRANLYVRTSNVKRSFGNKTTWDKPFQKHFVNFVEQANRAIFNNSEVCTSLNYDAIDLPTVNYDLVYIDTPYITKNGIGTDYLDFYHFLEGLSDYSEWNNKILDKYKHLPLKGKSENPWIKKELIYDSFDKLFYKFRSSIIVVSYRSDGIPTEDELIKLLTNYKQNVVEVKSKDYKYVLSHNNNSSEILFIANGKQK